MVRRPHSTKAGGASSSRFNQGVGGNHNNRVCLLNLVTSGLLNPGWLVNFRNHTALVTPKGTLRPNPDEPLSVEMSTEYETPSAWATAVCKMGRHGRVAVNGWSSVKVHVHCEAFDGRMQQIEVPLDTLRQKYLASTSGDAEMANLPLSHFLGDSRKRKLRPDGVNGKRTNSKTRRHNGHAAEPITDYTDAPVQRGRPQSTAATVDATLQGGLSWQGVPPSVANKSNCAAELKDTGPAVAGIRPTVSGSGRLGTTTQVPLHPGVESTILPQDGSTGDGPRKNVTQRLKNKRRKKLGLKISNWLDYRRQTRGVPWTFPRIRRLIVGQALRSNDGVRAANAILKQKSRAYLGESACSLLHTQGDFPCLPYNSEGTSDDLCVACTKGFSAPHTSSTVSKLESNKCSTTPFHCAMCSEDYHPACAGHDDQMDTGNGGSSTRSKPDHAPEGKPCAYCARCAYCQEAEPLGQLLQCDHCPRLSHVGCLSPAAITAIRQFRRWVCAECVHCHECGSRHPEGMFDLPAEDALDVGPNGVKNGTEDRFWVYDYTLCWPCGKLLEKGNLCPLCQGVYRDDDYETPMITCDTCGNWVHCACDDQLTTERYNRLVEDEASQYFCPICRKEQDESLMWTLPVAFERERVWVASIGGLRSSLLLQVKDQLPFKPRSNYGKAGQSDKVLSPAGGTFHLTLSSAQIDYSLEIHPQYDLGLVAPTRSQSLISEARDRPNEYGNAPSPGRPGGLRDLLLAATDSIPSSHNVLFASAPPTPVARSTFRKPSVSATTCPGGDISTGAVPSILPSEPPPSSEVDAAEVLLTLFSAEPSPSPAVSVPVSSNASPSPHFEKRRPDSAVATTFASSLPPPREPSTRRPSIAELLASPPLSSTTVAGSKPIKCLLCHGTELSPLGNTTNTGAVSMLPTPPTSIPSQRSQSKGILPATGPTVGTGRLLFLYSHTYPDAWAHVDCLLWLPDIHINDKYEVEGIEAALVRAQNTYCALCSRVGATVRCAAGSLCSTSYHVSCLFSKAQHLFPTDRRPSLYHHLRCLLCHVHAKTHHTLFANEGNQLDEANPTVLELNAMPLATAMSVSRPQVTEHTRVTSDMADHSPVGREPLTTDQRNASPAVLATIPEHERLSLADDTLATAYRIGNLMVSSIGRLADNNGKSDQEPYIYVTGDFPDFLAPIDYTCRRTLISYVHPGQSTSVRCQMVPWSYTSEPKVKLFPNVASQRQFLADPTLGELVYGAGWELTVADDMSANGTIRAPTLYHALEILFSRYSHGYEADLYHTVRDQTRFLRCPGDFVGLGNAHLLRMLSHKLPGYQTLYRTLVQPDVGDTRVTDALNIVYCQRDAYMETQSLDSWLTKVHPRVPMDDSCSAARTDLVYRRRVPSVARATTAVNAYGGVLLTHTHVSNTTSSSSPLPKDSGQGTTGNDDDLYAEYIRQYPTKPFWFVAPSECYIKTMEQLYEYSQDDPNFSKKVRALREGDRHHNTTLMDRSLPRTHQLPLSLYQTHYYANRNYSGHGSTRQRTGHNATLSPRSLFPSSGNSETSASNSPELRGASLSDNDGHREAGTDTDRRQRMGSEPWHLDLDEVDASLAEPDNSRYNALSVFGTFGHRIDQPGILLPSPDPVGLGAVVNRVACAGIGAFFRVVGHVHSSRMTHPSKYYTPSDYSVVSHILQAPALRDLSENNRRFWEQEVPSYGEDPGWAAHRSLQRSTLGLFTSHSFEKGEVVLEVTGELIGKHQAYHRQLDFLNITQRIVGDTVARGRGSGNVGRPPRLYATGGPSPTSRFPIPAENGTSAVEAKSPPSPYTTTHSPASGSAVKGCATQRYPPCIMVRASRDWFVDLSATRSPCGYVQHSARPNLYPRTLCLKDGRLRVVLCAARNIDTEEELTLSFE
ncbi:hypothetical protein IWQ62_001955 [Dispira parvispora]|uniref:Uncharacterized protein n=1 Tax=Dispira parvispora TaxID=1520584 RepID=A0A9W8ARE9_9FUNG|nr:hypothetical protein IWQ62_001955 [Dispira parvispora]